ncbi:hypothetical protein BUALT_Bualt03G0217500 [Buddleja alternifolia]|uniref:Uncharacterized protein n=1 Tax=Buddleja alternifolia TaxID=168488 RepID=A0AAV6XXE9_9LAMI|nr:hypothetical protein BUALT_Bualt03G0217500 [Buddleja alternifolia]
MGETIVIHWMHHCLYDVTGSDLNALRLLTSLRPKLITVVEQDLSHGRNSGAQLFGSQIRNIVVVGGQKRTGEVKVEWEDELVRVGFRPVSLAGNPAAQASLLLGKFPWQGYSLVEENECLKLGWKDFSLLTASAWKLSD